VRYNALKANKFTQISYQLSHLRQTRCEVVDWIWVTQNWIR